MYTKERFVLDKKVIGLIAGYAVVMAGLLFITFSLQWTPSGYSYSLEDQTLTIEEGHFQKEITTVDISNQQEAALRYSLAVSVERQHWRMDVTIIGLLLPFILFLFVPNRRPLKNTLPYKWYIGIIAAVVVLYGSYSIPNYVDEINEVQEYAEQLK